MIEGLVYFAFGLLILVIGFAFGAAWVWELWSKELGRVERELDARPTDPPGQWGRMGVHYPWCWRKWLEAQTDAPCICFEHPEVDWTGQLKQVTEAFERQAWSSRMLRGQRVPIGLRRRGIPLVENPDGRAEIDRVTRRRMSDE